IACGWRSTIAFRIGDFRTAAALSRGGRRSVDRALKQRPTTQSLEDLDHEDRSTDIECAGFNYGPCGGEPAGFRAAATKTQHRCHHGRRHRHVEHWRLSPWHDGR